MKYICLFYTIILGVMSLRKWWSKIDPKWPKIAHLPYCVIKLVGLEEFFIIVFPHRESFFVMKYCSMLQSYVVYPWGFLHFSLPYNVSPLISFNMLSLIKLFFIMKYSSICTNLNLVTYFLFFSNINFLTFPNCTRKIEKIALRIA